jgi:hypothetical protein
MRVLLALLLLPGLLCVGCGKKKVDTSHRNEPGFVDTMKDPTAIMPKGPGGAPVGAPKQ